jgi:competence protein ComEC
LNIVGIPVGTILIEFLFLLVFLNFIKIQIFNILIVKIVKFTYDSFEGFIYVGSKIPLLQINLDTSVSMFWIAIYYLCILYIILMMKEKNIRYEKVRMERKKKVVVVTDEILK